LLAVFYPMPLASAQKLTPADRAKVFRLYQQAVTQEKSKDYAAAIKTMAEVLEIVPKNDQYIAYTARLESLAGQHEQAISHAQEALKLKPKTPAYELLLLTCAYEAHDYDQAREHVGKVVALGAGKLGPQNFETARIIQGFLNVQKGDADFKEIDQHALKAPALAEDSIDTLAEYLVKPAKNDREKARAIYRWITDRIAYDADGFFSGQLGDNSPQAVLKRRMSVCQGYAALYEALAKQAKLEAVLVSGAAKGIGTRAGGHAWNAVKIDDKWHLLDATWGAGSCDGNSKKFIKRFTNYYFLIEPDALILSHLPRTEKWQLLGTPVPNDEFMKWPKIGTDLIQSGIKPEELRKRLTDNPDFEFVQSWAFPGTRLVLKKVPLEKKLKPGVQSFQVEAYGFREMVFIHNKKATPLTRNGNTFQGSLPLQAGDLTISAKKINGDSYWTLLEYKVE
jgi:transglutaminase-like putative cysteine protease